MGGQGILLVVSLFVSQARLSLHLLTLWEAQVGLHPGGAREDSLAMVAEGSMRFRIRQAWPLPTVLSWASHSLQGRDRSCSGTTAPERI